MRRPATKNTASRMPITIHIVNSVLVMLTLAPTIGSGSWTAPSATGGQMTCGAGNSRLAMIRSPMPVIGSPGSPIGNGGTTIEATTSSAITATISSRMFRRRLDFGFGGRWQRRALARLRRPRLARRPRWPGAGQSTPFLRIGSGGGRRARVFSP